MHPQQNIRSEKSIVNKAVVRAAKLLNLSQKELSEIIGPSQSEISRLFLGTKDCLTQNTKEWECALLFLRAFRSLDALLGGDDKQNQEWFKSYNHHLGEKPIELSKKIEGLSEIVVYLDAMRGLA